MKRIISIMMIVVMALLITSCNSFEPQDAVDGYFRAAQKLDSEAMASNVMASEEAFDFLKLEDEEDYGKYFSDYLEESAGKMTYKIVDVEADGDNAIVTVDCKYIDGSFLYIATVAEFFGQMIGMAFEYEEYPPEEEVRELFIGIMEEEAEGIEETYIESTIEVEMIYYEDSWYIAKVSDEMLDVVWANFITAGNELQERFDNE